MLNYIYLVYITYKVTTDLKYYMDRFGMVYYTYKGASSCANRTVNYFYRDKQIQSRQDEIKEIIE